MISSKLISSHFMDLLKRRASHLNEGAPDIVLKYDDGDQQDGTEYSAQEPQQGPEVQLPGDKID